MVSPLSPCVMTMGAEPSLSAVVWRDRAPPLFSTSEVEVEAVVEAVAAAVAAGAAVGEDVAHNCPRGGQRRPQQWHLGWREMFMHLCDSAPPPL